MRKAITKMLTIFPFEEGIYLAQNFPSRFVGHPLTTVVPALSDLEDRPEFCRRLGIEGGAYMVAIMPGSRKNEIRAHMPVAIAAMKQIMAERSDVNFCHIGSQRQNTATNQTEPGEGLYHKRIG